MRDFDSTKFVRDTVVPVGTIEFVQTFLSKAYGIAKMNPIEVPKELRIPSLMLRNYHVLHVDDSKELHGKFFIKSATRLKAVSILDDIDKVRDILKPDICVFSEQVDFLAEYRVFVYRDKIIGIQFYDGNPLIMPTPEQIKKIQEMVVRYSVNKNRPKAYTLDVGITEQGICPIEVHPWCSIGLYGLTGSFLPEAYIQGFKWYVEKNIPIQPDIPHKAIEDLLVEDLLF